MLLKLLFLHNVLRIFLELKEIRIIKPADLPSDLSKLAAAEATSLNLGVSVVTAVQTALH